MQQQKQPERTFADLHPLLGKVYVHHLNGFVVITTANDPDKVGPANILARIEPFSGPSRTRPSDYEKILGANIAHAMNMERGQL